MSKLMIFEINILIEKVSVYLVKMGIIDGCKCMKKLK